MRNTRYSDLKSNWEEHRLKHRGWYSAHKVPIPPQTCGDPVRSHRMFQSRGGRPTVPQSKVRRPNQSDYVHHRLGKGPEDRFSPAQFASPLATVPHDCAAPQYQPGLLRAFSRPDVADRGGHAVGVLLKFYARCLDGQRDATNNRTAAKLAGDM